MSSITCYIILFLLDVVFHDGGVFSSATHVIVHVILSEGTFALFAYSTLTSY